MALILSMLVYEVSTIHRHFHRASLMDLSLGDTTKLIMALMDCLLGYGEVGLWLQKESKNENSWVVMEGNPYELWIDDYSGEVYQRAVQAGLGKFQCFFLHFFY